MTETPNRRITQLAELAGGTAHVAIIEYEKLAYTLDQIAKGGVGDDPRAIDDLMGELGVVFQILAGHVEQIRMLQFRQDRVRR